MQVRNILTSIFGVLAGVASLLQQQNVTIGHVGNTNFVPLVGAAALIALGFVSKDFNTHSTVEEVKEATKEVEAPKTEK